MTLHPKVKGIGLAAIGTAAVGALIWLATITLKFFHWL